MTTHNEYDLVITGASGSILWVVRLQVFRVMRTPIHGAERKLLSLRGTRPDEVASVCT